MAENDVTSPYYEALQDRPSSIITLKTSVAAMAVNNDNNSLLYCPEGSFLLTDEQGNEMLNVQRKFKVSDMCFSSFLKQFLILAYKPDYALYSLDPSTHELKQIKQFSQIVWSCTCYDTTLIISEANNGSKIEFVDLRTNYNSIEIFTAPSSCQADEQIEKIRFNSDGSRLGVILRQGSKPYYRHWFELRDSANMTVIVKTKLDPDNDEWCWLLTLPDRQFLVTLWRRKKIFLLDSDGKLLPTSGYYNYANYLNSIALVNGRCLAVQTWQPDELHFHNL